jgi:hypothetical protein
MCVSAKIDTHARDAFLPAFDHLALSQAKRERLATIARAVYLNTTCTLLGPKNDKCARQFIESLRAYLFTVLQRQNIVTLDPLSLLRHLPIALLDRVDLNGHFHTSVSWRNRLMIVCTEIKFAVFKCKALKKKRKMRAKLTTRGYEKGVNIQQTKYPLNSIAMEHKRKQIMNRRSV